MSAGIANSKDNASLDVIVPEDSEYSIDNLLRLDTSEGNEESSGLSLSDISQRSVLHFDESITIYLVLRTGHNEAAQLLSFIKSLDIVLEVLAYTPHPKSEYRRHAPQSPSPSPHQDSIWQGSIDTSQKPSIRVRDGHQAEAIWRVLMTLNRPRIRLLSPMISFRPSATIRRPLDVSSGAPEDRYLPSGVPTSVNLLESIKDERGLHGVVPRLPAPRLSRINTTNADPTLSRTTLRVEPQQDFRAIPAITSRVRYSNASAVGGKPTLLASLDIETATFFNHDIRIQTVQLKLSEGSTDDLNRGSEPLLPMTCRPRDNVTFLFRLVSAGVSSDPVNTSSNSKTLDISIDAIVLASKTCKPRIRMRWRTAVDFSTSLNPTFGAPSQPLSRHRRPANISMSQITSNEFGTAETGQAPTMDDGRREHAFSTGDLGVSVTFTAPREIYVGEPFCWDVFVVNRSNRPRKLALTPFMKRKKVEPSTHLSKPSALSVGGGQELGIADAVVDESILYATQKNAGKDAVEIIGLNNELKIGPLVPGSCFNGELKFLPLTKGVLQIDSVRVTDTIANESVDVRNLPDMIAGERE